MINVAILAGGRGSRLAGMWDLPKCLVPIVGRPLILRLLDALDPVGVRNVNMLLGPGADQVVAEIGGDLVRRWWFSFVVRDPRGTAEALRYSMSVTCRAPLLVLNGDTLPLYDLRSLVSFYENVLPQAAVAFADGKNAGACVLGADSLCEIKDTAHGSLDVYLAKAERHYVRGFLDVGTPEGFARSQLLKEEDLWKFPT